MTIIGNIPYVSRVKGSAILEDMGLTFEEVDPNQDDKETMAIYNDELHDYFS